MKRIRNITFALLAVTAAVAFAADGFKLRRTPKVGEEINMRLTADVEVMGVNATFTAKIKDKVLKVDANGDYTIESTQSEGKISFNGQDMDAPGGEATSTKYSANGAILEMKGTEVSDDQMRIANMSAFNFEDKTYNVGDKIAYETKPAKSNGNVGAKVELVVAGTEKVGEWDAVKVTYNYKELTGEAPAESTGTAWLSTKDATVIKVEGNYKNAPFPGAPGPINAKIKMERI
jgi:hypothetical protein